MLDEGQTVIFRPYVYELIDNGDGQFTLWYSLWIPSPDRNTARSITVDFIDVATNAFALRKHKPPRFSIMGRGEGDSEALVEVWIEPDPEDT